MFQWTFNIHLGEYKRHKNQTTLVTWCSTPNHLSTPVLYLANAWRECCWHIFARWRYLHTILIVCRKSCQQVWFSNLTIKQSVKFHNQQTGVYTVCMYCTVWLLPQHSACSCTITDPQCAQLCTVQVIKIVICTNFATQLCKVVKFGLETAGCST